MISKTKTFTILFTKLLIFLLVEKIFSKTMTIYKKILQSLFYFSKNDFFLTIDFVKKIYLKKLSLFSFKKGFSILLKEFWEYSMKMILKNFKFI